MESQDLSKQQCVPCHGGVSPLAAAKARELLAGTPGWEMGGKPPKITREFQFEDFARAMEFVNRVAALAEQQGHHPDIEISWSRVSLTLWTHAIQGLHENDFIMAARINALAG